MPQVHIGIFTVKLETVDGNSVQGFQMGNVLTTEEQFPHKKSSRTIEYNCGHHVIED